ncbi:16392_t:CDS:2 [Cetraspora pellucida]|uniref:16392_t:CDS:1 n=1 Tax=Cetraspora pellucida TaxID=1433469 RepID=A0ACA9M792_9GLOM|nr:16392_t:CDS:2 [Cetraspora pellucida]
MVTCIESRWKEWEQPLLILSFVLHPLYKLSRFHESVRDLLWTHIGQLLKYYYEAWSGSKPVSILAELIKYKKEIDPYNIDSFKHFKENLIDFWEFTNGMGPELAKVAIRIHGTCVNSASPKKVFAMSQIRSDILQARKIKEIKECEREMRQLHIATPIVSDNEITEPKLNNEEDFYQVSDDDEKNSANDNEDIITYEEEQKWDQLIQEWINLGVQENQFEDQNDQIFMSSEWDYDFEIEDQEKHPADDTLAK